MKDRRRHVLVNVGLMQGLDRGCAEDAATVIRTMEKRRKNMTHNEPHPMAGKTATIKVNAGEDPQGLIHPDSLYRVEDWADRVMGGSVWMQQGNIACLHYAIRSTKARLPIDDEVVYGKIGPFGHLLHVSELGEEVEA